MNNYVEIVFSNISEQQSELLIAELNNLGFEGFEEDADNLKAFIGEQEYDDNLVKEITKKLGLEFSKSIIEETNWNEVWESNFQPVIVDDFVAVRADFHEPINTVEQEIIITPKMSFGTGHHATTFMMMQQMRDIDFTNKKVFDFGTGTGVLAILAEKLNAISVIAVDNDEWSISNASENLQRNNCSRIELQKTDSADLNETFDITLANINKNVILDNYSLLVKQLKAGGVILFSGLLKEDEPDIVKEARRHLLVFAGRSEKDNWLCLKFVR